MVTEVTLDEAKLEAFMGKMVGDVGAAATAPLVLLGDKLGLYKALAEAGPLSAAELAQRTGTHERYIREWLAAQAASEYVTYDAVTDRYAMTPEQQMALADEESPVFLAGLFDSLAALFLDEPKVREAFRSGNGVGWHEHSPGLFCGTERSSARATKPT